MLQRVLRFLLDSTRRQDVRFHSDAEVWCGRSKATLQDVSMGGMRLSLPFLPPKGKELSLCSGNLEFEVKCRVMWVKPTATGSEVGLSFQDTREAKGRWIHRLLYP